MVIEGCRRGFQPNPTPNQFFVDFTKGKNHRAIARGTEEEQANLLRINLAILVVIGIAIATGHYGDLQTWARREAAEALMWRRPLPYFFRPIRHLSDKQTAMPRNTPKAAKKPSKL